MKSDNMKFEQWPMPGVTPLVILYLALSIGGGGGRGRRGDNRI